MTTKRSANSLTRSSTLGASVWAPTVGFATLGMATVAAITMVGLEQGVDHVHGTPAADGAAARPPVVRLAPEKAVAAAKPVTAKPRMETASFKTVGTAVADASATKARLTQVPVALHHVTGKAAAVTGNAVKKTNAAPKPTPKGASDPVSRPAPGAGSGSGSTSGGSTGTPSQGSGSGVGVSTPVLDVKVAVGSGDVLGTGLHL